MDVDFNQISLILRDVKENLANRKHEAAVGSCVYSSVLSMTRAVSLRGIADLHLSAACIGQNGLQLLP